MEESNKRGAAERLRDLAEDKFKAGDTDGARKMALKAQVIFPSLHGLSGMIAAFDVHIAAATRKLSTGGIDWYAVLGMSEASAVDANIIRKQLKKMRLLTHPDKNCSTASTDAFRLVQEAGESILKSSAGKRALSNDDNEKGKRTRRNDGDDEPAPTSSSLSNDVNEKGKRTRRNDGDDEPAPTSSQQQRRETCHVCDFCLFMGIILSEKNRRALGCPCPHRRSLFDL